MVSDCKDCGAYEARYCKSCTDDTVDKAIRDTEPLERSRARAEVHKALLKTAGEEFQRGNDDRAKWLRKFAEQWKD